MSIFTDEAEIIVQSGKGGDGVISFRREKYIPRGGPDGGDGGDGGDIVFIVVERLRSLYELKLKKVFKAKNGKPGDKKNRSGVRGRDCIIPIPRGTIIREKETSTIVGDLTKVGQKLLCLKGGKGGYGNAHFATSVNRAPRIFKPGRPGRRAEFIVQLKMIADVGLVGLPNAGKSTLLSVLTKAQPKIGDYPFTTLYPNLGVMEYNNERQIVLADIPGIIEGAHNGHGLGIKFLKHIERTSILLFLIDISNNDFKKSYEILQEELTSYSKILSNKGRLIVGSKVDLVDDSQSEKFISEFPDNIALTVSSVSGEGIRKLKNQIAEMLEKNNDSS